jgi:phage shock protein PspC (stress-responsive transcriptional regulator)
MSTGVATMPSLIRLLTIVAILCGAVYGGLYALAHFVQPTPRQMSVYIPPTKFYQAH